MHLSVLGLLRVSPPNQKPTPSLLLFLEIELYYRPVNVIAQNQDFTPNLSIFHSYSLQCFWVYLRIITLALILSIPGMLQDKGVFPGWMVPVNFHE